MSKKLTVIDKSSGEVLEDIEFSGGYNIQYACNEDSGRIKHVAHLDNANFDGVKWIKTAIYRPVCKKLAEKFEELKHLKSAIGAILFLEDMNWKEKSGKRSWIARISKTNNQFREMTGYHYILETRNYYIDKMSKEQIAALLYHELRHIDKNGDLVEHDIEDWSNMVATLGVDWATTMANIQDILEEDFEGWNSVIPIARQTNMFDRNLRAVK
jgi:predicted metallopeptidase